MSRRSRDRSAKADAKPAARRSGADAAPLRADRSGGRRAALTLAGAAALIVAGALSLAPLRRYVGSLRAPEHVRVRLPTPGGAANLAGSIASGASWLPESEQRRLVALVDATIAADPFDVASLRRARAALLATGWFSDVRRVQRKPGGEVEIDATWRAPAAVVRWKGRDYLVSDEARLLPLVYEPGAPDAPRAILGVWMGPPTTADGSLALGEVWKGGDVEAAVSLLKRLRERDDAWRRVAAIDVSRWSRNGALAVLSPDGAEIVWGSAPGQEQPWERAPAAKLDLFVSLWQNELWISRGKPLVELHKPVAMMDDRPGG